MKGDFLIQNPSCPSFSKGRDSKNNTSSKNKIHPHPNFFVICRLDPFSTVGGEGAPVGRMRVNQNTRFEYCPLTLTLSHIVGEGDFIWAFFEN